jgi:hypothetical protein
VVIYARNLLQNCFMTITTRGIKMKIATLRLLITIASSLAVASWVKGATPTVDDVGDAGSLINAFR